LSSLSKVKLSIRRIRRWRLCTLLGGLKWTLMQKYYKMTEESPAYIAALVLDPNSKWSYVESNWKREWVTSARSMMDYLWEKYKPDPLQSLASIASQPEESGKNAFSQWKKRHQSTPNVEDEYKRYCAAEVTYYVKPRYWGLERLSKRAILISVD
jgi:hypothetical protein